MGLLLKQLWIFCVQLTLMIMLLFRISELIAVVPLNVHGLGGWVVSFNVGSPIVTTAIKQ